MKHWSKIRTGALTLGGLLALVLGTCAVLAQEHQGETSMQLESGYIEVNGGRLYYEETGTGDCIVLVHDGLVHHEIWDAQFPVFAQAHRVIRYDRRGYGLSEPPQAPYSDVEDMLSVFEQLGIERAWLMGMSAGGGLTIDFTLTHPEKVTGLVLVGAVVSGFAFTSHGITRGGRMTPAMLNDPEALRLFITQDPYEIAPANTAARERFRELLNAYPGNADLEKLGMVQPLKVPAVGRLGEIQVPTLVVTGEFDLPDVQAHAGAIAAGISGAQRVVISDAGHLVPLEQPEDLTLAVQTFLEERIENLR